MTLGRLWGGGKSTWGEEGGGGGEGGEGGGGKSTWVGVIPHVGHSPSLLAFLPFRCSYTGLSGKGRLGHGTATEVDPIMW